MERYAGGLLAITALCRAVLRQLTRYGRKGADILPWLQMSGVTPGRLMFRGMKRAGTFVQNCSEASDVIRLMRRPIIEFPTLRGRPKLR
jgi:hypothetical protein